MAKKSSTNFSRNDLRYWEERVYRPRYGRGDQFGKEAGSFAVRIQAHGERRGVSLRDTTKRNAAKSAMLLEKLIEAKGWDCGLLEFRGETPKPRNLLTLGEYFAEIEAIGYFQPRTLRIYKTKVRRIAADVGKVRLAGKVKKFDHINGGAEAWQNLVDKVPLQKLAPVCIREWQTNHLKNFHNNPAKYKSATKTTNSCIRAGKAIFSGEVKKLLPHLILPDPCPFEGIKTAREEITRYRSEIRDPESLLLCGAMELADATTESELQRFWEADGGTGKAPVPTPSESVRAVLSAERKREAFKVLIIGLTAGLRRGEIDHLLWTQIDFDNGQINVETTDVHQPKADSEGSILVDPEILELYRQWKESSESRFVIAGVEPRVDSQRAHYRANRAEVELLTWLKSKGIKARNPIHSLRKEFGSIICEKAGVYVASRLLRHASIAMTAAIYTDDRKKVTSGLGSALSKRSKV
jgi:integrase